jgi:hypothetical protein
MARNKNYLGDKKDWLIEKLKELHSEHGDLIPRDEIKSMKLREYPSVGTYEKYFGSWNNAKREAGLPVNPQYQGIRKRRPSEKQKKGDTRFTPLKLRFLIFTRDNFTCQYCGRRVEDGAKLVIDHIRPFSKGGKTTEDNLVTACFECNMGKRDILLKSDTEE